MNLQQIRYRLENLRGQRDRLDADIEAGEARVAKLKQDSVDAEEARAVVQAVAQQTQRQLEYHISEIVSLALAAVFDNPYALSLAFVVRRNKTEADIFFERDGQQFRPIDAAGGGAVDVAAFALRVAMWSLRRPRPRATLVLDEPGKFLSADRRYRMGAMMSEMSKRLNLQIIMVSHAEEYIEAADKCFQVTIHNGVSKVVEINRSDDHAAKGTTSERRGQKEDIGTSEKVQSLPQVQQDSSASRQGHQKQSNTRGRRRN